MKPIHIVLLSTLTILPIKIYTQTSVCLHDSAKVYVESHRGEIQWQSSPNGVDWSYANIAGVDTINLIGTESYFYRAEILEGTCAPVYSSIFELQVINPPIVLLEIQDSVCINTTPFILTGGNPLGGEYWGTGVIDGKFSPITAGLGLHDIFYSYQDTVYFCKDTTSATIRVLPLPDNAQAGADQLSIPIDSIRLDANVPFTGTGTWNIEAGTGGILSNIHDPKSWFKKAEGVFDYTLVWRIETSCGVNSDMITLNFENINPYACPGTPSVTDADGNVYPTVQIGNQCWMARNLNVGKFVRSTATNTPHGNLSNNGVIEKYCLNNDEANCEIYGGLYDWHEVMNYSETPGVQGICPTGWHVPDNDDWQTLDDFYKYGEAGKYLKVGGGSGFEGLLAGDRHADGSFVSFESSGFFWSSSTYTYQEVNDGYFRELCACNSNLDRSHFSKLTGVSIRCIKD